MPELPTLPPIANEPISVALLVPTNEQSLQDEIGAWVQFLNVLSNEFEILIAACGDPANSEMLAPILAGPFPSVRVLGDSNATIGPALSRAIAEARHPLFFYTILGKRFQPGDLKLLLNEIDKVHLVSGFRFWQPAPLLLKIIGFIYRGLARLFFGLPMERLPGWLGWKNQVRRFLMRCIFGLRLHDVECPYRLFRRSIFRRMPIQSAGDFVHIELLAKANYLGHLMTEVPVKYTPMGAGSSSSMFHEARQLFSHPDFGPAILTEEVQPAVS